jgi:nitrogen regulatory protein P-II 2
MRTVPVVCLTIVAESVVEQRLLRDLAAAGARGWGTTHGHGSGDGFTADGAWDGGTVRIETLVSAEAADALLEVLARDYFPHFAVVAWTAEVNVVRPAKFT